MIYTQYMSIYMHNMCDIWHICNVCQLIYMQNMTNNMKINMSNHLLNMSLNMHDMHNIHIFQYAVYAIIYEKKYVEEYCKYDIICPYA